MAEIQFDTISWTRDGNNDIMPLLPPKPFNYPVESDVRFPVVYSYDLDRVGTLTAGAPPAMPILTIQDMESGVARFTISGSTATTTNQVFIRETTTLTWGLVPVVTIIGDGFADATLDPGPYLAKVRSSLGSAIAPAANEPILFHLQDAGAGYTRSDFGDEFQECALPDMLSTFGEPVLFIRGVQSIALSGIQGDAIMHNDPTTGMDVTVGDASWEISAEAVDFGSGPIVPKMQDQIITAKGEVYVVVEAGVLDSEQIMWTIPVKRSDYKELP